MDLTNTFVPQILDYSPTSLTTDVASRPPITVKFSMDMLIGTLTADQTQADTYLAGNIICVCQSSGSRLALVFVSYDAKNCVLTMQPAAALDPGEVNVVTVLAGFASAAGRGIGVDETWTFEVAATQVPQVTLASPIDGYTTTEIPVFVWSQVSAGAADTVTYHLQIATDFSFATLVVDNAAVVNNFEDRLSSMVLKTEATYYWRVRAAINGVYGLWSAARALRMQSPATIETQPGGTIFDTFGLVASYPPPGSSNLSEWPVVRLDFNRDVSANTVGSGIFVSASHADTGAKVEVGDLTASVTGPRLELSIAGEIAPNTRYTISITRVEDYTGKPIANPQTLTFTGPYLPLYSTAEVLRGDYGRFLTRFNDEEINFQIHRCSVRCNRYILRRDQGGAPPGCPSTALVYDLLNDQPLTYDMSAYVEAAAAYALIQLYQFELLSEAGRRLALDTIMSQVDPAILTDIDAVLSELAKTVKRLEYALRGGVPRPRSGVKSKDWEPSEALWDQSVRLLPRGYF